MGSKRISEDAAPVYPVVSFIVLDSHNLCDCFVVDMMFDWENDLNILGLYAKESETALDRIERLKTVLSSHDRHVTDLLNANNALLERARSAEQRIKLLEKFINTKGYDAPS